MKKSAQKVYTEQHRRDIKGVPIDVRCKTRVFDELDEACSKEGCPKLVYFLNAHCVNQAFSDTSYLETLHRADYVLNDGIGVDIGAWFHGFKFKENLVGTDFIPDYIHHIRNKPLRVFFFGAKPEVLKALLSKYKRIYPNLVISGLDGYSLPIMSKMTVQTINDFKADIVVLGLGVPLQEKWADSCSKDLGTVKVIFAGGAVLDNMSDSIKRAPKWVRRLKSEWLFRIYLEPIRLGKRYFFGIPQYFINIVFRTRRRL
ncbi:MAG: WecB/TagA/CpsF family glycosyltransferase [Flavobacteriales bacterium]|nr:WecB/TagA/CpsF family glycosyltransferase [Flavobacteriales bacterium]